MNPERLAELQRQRELVRQHLAWLDREIAAGTKGAASRPTPPAPTFLSSAAPVSPTPSSVYEPDPVATAASTKRGCLFTAAALLVLGMALMTAFLLFRYSDRSLIFAEPAKPTATAPSPSR